MLHEGEGIHSYNTFLSQDLLFPLKRDYLDKILYLERKNSGTA